MASDLHHRTWDVQEKDHCIIALVSLYGQQPAQQALHLHCFSRQPAQQGLRGYFERHSARAVHPKYSIGTSAIFVGFIKTPSG